MLPDLLLTKQWLRPLNCPLGLQAVPGDKALGGGSRLDWPADASHPAAAAFVIGC